MYFIINNIRLINLFPQKQNMYEKMLKKLMMLNIFHSVFSILQWFAWYIKQYFQFQRGMIGWRYRN